MPRRKNAIGKVTKAIEKVRGDNPINETPAVIEEKVAKLNEKISKLNEQKNEIVKSLREINNGEFRKFFRPEQLKQESIDNTIARQQKVLEDKEKNSASPKEDIAQQKQIIKDLKEIKRLTNKNEKLSTQIEQTRNTIKNLEEKLPSKAPIKEAKAKPASTQKPRSQTAPSAAKKGQPANQSLNNKKDTSQIKEEVKPIPSPQPTLEGVGKQVAISNLQVIQRASYEPNAQKETELANLQNLKNEQLANIKNLISQIQSVDGKPLDPKDFSKDLIDMTIVEEEIKVQNPSVTRANGEELTIERNNLNKMQQIDKAYQTIDILDKQINTLSPVQMQTDVASPAKAEPSVTTQTRMPPPKPEAPKPTMPQALGGEKAPTEPQITPQKAASPNPLQEPQAPKEQTRSKQEIPTLVENNTQKIVTPDPVQPTISDAQKLADLKSNLEKLAQGQKEASGNLSKLTAEYMSLNPNANRNDISTKRGLEFILNQESKSLTTAKSGGNTALAEQLQKNVNILQSMSLTYDALAEASQKITETRQTIAVTESGVGPNNAQATTAPSTPTLQEELDRLVGIRNALQMSDQKGNENTNNLAKVQGEIRQLDERIREQKAAIPAQTTAPRQAKIELNRPTTLRENLDRLKQQDPQNYKNNVQQLLSSAFNTLIDYAQREPIGINEQRIQTNLLESLKILSKEVGPLELQPTVVEFQNNVSKLDEKVRDPLNAKVDALELPGWDKNRTPQNVNIDKPNLATPAPKLETTNMDKKTEEVKSTVVDEVKKEVKEGAKEEAPKNEKKPNKFLSWTAIGIAGAAVGIIAIFAGPIVFPLIAAVALVAVAKASVQILNAVKDLLTGIFKGVKGVVEAPVKGVKAIGKRLGLSNDKVEEKGVSPIEIPKVEVKNEVKDIPKDNKSDISPKASENEKVAPKPLPKTQRVEDATAMRNNANEVIKPNEKEPTQKSPLVQTVEKLGQTIKDNVKAETPIAAPKDAPKPLAATPPKVENEAKVPPLKPDAPKPPLKVGQGVDNITKGGAFKPTLETIPEGKALAPKPLPPTPNRENKAEQPQVNSPKNSPTDELKKQAAAVMQKSQNEVKAANKITDHPHINTLNQQKNDGKVNGRS